MLPHGIKDLRVVELTAVKPGSFFFHIEKSKSVLAVAMVRHDEAKPMWLNLDGPFAFELQETAKTSYVKRVLVLNVPDRLQLRIDHTSLVASNEVHQIGRLVVDEEDAACIAAVWPHLEKEGYRNAVALKSWIQTQLGDSRFVFDTWALSYVDDSGQWIDLVKRGPALTT